jgi:hypothetical protein
VHDVTEPTPRERHLHDLLSTVKARLRHMAADTGLTREARTQAAKLADFVDAQMNRGVGE